MKAAPFTLGLVSVGQQGTAVVARAERALARASLSPRHAAVARRALWARRLTASGSEGARIGVTASKWGGAPDLPVHVEVPPLGLLCQVNLAHLPPPFVSASGLPPSGLLSFFFDFEGEPFVVRPGEPGARVLYTPSRETFVRRAKGQEAGVKERALGSELEVSLPPIDSALFTSEPGDPEADFRYSRTVAAVEALGGGEPLHRFLGHPTPVQGDMQRLCALLSRGMDTGAAQNLGRDLTADERAAARRFRLLLQVDSCDELEWAWGDGGRLYFWIQDEDLLAGAFHRTIVIQQCH